MVQKVKKAWKFKRPKLLELHSKSSNDTQMDEKIFQKWKLFLVAKFSRGDNKCCMSNCNEVSKTNKTKFFRHLDALLNFKKLWKRIPISITSPFAVVWSIFIFSPRIFAKICFPCHFPLALRLGF